MKKESHTIQHTALFLCFFLPLLLYACTTPKIRIPAKGVMAEQTIDTTVDSETARYYLENYLQGLKSDPYLDANIDRIHHSIGNTLPDNDSLKVISKKFSPDFGALYLAHSLAHIQSNRQMLSAFYKEIRKTKEKLEKGGFRLDPKVASCFFLFAPGWLYQTDPDTGADFAKIRSILNKFRIKTHLIKTEESGPVEKNAAIIAREIVRQSSRHDRIILVSSIKSGAETALAIGNLMDEGRRHHLKAWINIGGLLNGSKLADKALTGTSRWWTRDYFGIRGWDMRGVESLMTDRRRKSFQQLQFPDDLLIINYIGVPLSGHVSTATWDDYQELNKEGPNDCRMTILDGIVPETITIPQLGFDHFFWDPELFLKVVALIQVITKDY